MGKIQKLQKENESIYPIKLEAGSMVIGNIVKIKHSINAEGTAY